MSIELPDGMEPLRAFIESHRRDCWVPVVQSGDGPLDASKFSGTPWLQEGESWPRCMCCGKPMQLFAQVNFGTTPKATQKQFGSRLFQVFLCIEGECLYVETTTPCWLVRFTDGTNQADRIVTPKFRNPLPPKQIIQWAHKDDYPDHPDLEDAGLAFPDSGDVIRCPSINFEAEARLTTIWPSATWFRERRSAGGPSGATFQRCTPPAQSAAIL